MITFEPFVVVMLLLLIVICSINSLSLDFRLSAIEKKLDRLMVSDVDDDEDGDSI